MHGCSARQMNCVRMLSLISESPRCSHARPLALNYSHWLQSDWHCFGCYVVADIPAMNWIWSTNGRHSDIHIKDQTTHKEKNDFPKMVGTNRIKIKRNKLFNTNDMHTGNSSPTGRWWISVIGAAGRASLDLFPFAMSRNSSVYSCYWFSIFFSQEMATRKFASTENKKDQRKNKNMNKTETRRHRFCVNWKLMRQSTHGWKEMQNNSWIT